MITVGILRCDVCGAPMYPNPAKQAFCCPFCGNVSAYGMQQSRMKHEHKKLGFTEEGYFSLKRVAVLTPLSVQDELLAKRKWRTFDELVQLFDRRAFVTNKNRKEFSFACPACGAPVQGNDLMSMFECRYCGTKYSFEDAAEHGYIKIARIIGYEGMLPKLRAFGKIGAALPVSAVGAAAFSAVLTNGNALMTKQRKTNIRSDSHGGRGFHGGGHGFSGGGGHGGGGFSGGGGSHRF